MSSSSVYSSESDIEEYSNKTYNKLQRGEIKIKGAGKKGKVLRCPFCLGKKIKHYDAKELHQHSSDIRGSSKRKTKEKANHGALANYLKNYILDETPKNVDLAEGSSNKEPMMCYPWVGIIAAKGLDIGDFNEQYLMNQLQMFKPEKIVLLEDNGVPIGKAIINFGETNEGWYRVSELGTFYEKNKKGKKDYAKEKFDSSGIYGWFADADDYGSLGIVGDYLRNNVQLKRFSDVDFEKKKEKQTMIDDLVDKIDAKQKELDDLKMMKKNILDDSKTGHSLHD